MKNSTVADSSLALLPFSSRTLLCASLLCASLLCALGTGAAQAATLSGRVVASAALPEPARLAVVADAGLCGTDGAIADPRLVLGADRELADVVVVVADADSPPPYPPHDVPPTMDQVGCEFVPHVLIVAPGETVRAGNSDALLHSFHTFSKRNRSFSRTQLKDGTFETSFTRPEIIKVGCDIHYWMSGRIVVAEHAFTTVTGSDGSFAIEGLPAGDYHVLLSHERLGERTVAVSVGAGGGRLDYEWQPSDEELVALAEPTPVSGCCGGMAGGCMAMAAGGEGGEGVDGAAAPGCGMAAGCMAAADDAVGDAVAAPACGAPGGCAAMMAAPGGAAAAPGGESAMPAGCPMMQQMMEMQREQAAAQNGAEGSGQQGEGSGAPAAQAPASAADSAMSGMPAGCPYQRAAAAAAAAAAAEAERGKTSDTPSNQ